jgi:hypothetical protein
MRVQFRDNLGSRDAEKHALDFRACGRGMECDVPDKTGQQLVARGFAIEVAAIPEVIAAVPDVPSISEAEEPEIKAETKPARGAAKKSTTIQKDE